MSNNKNCRTREPRNLVHYTLEVTAEIVPISVIPILIFLCIFITASSPVSHTILIFAPGEKINSNLEVKLYKMCLKGQGQSIDSEKYTCQNGHIPTPLTENT